MSRSLGRRIEKLERHFGLAPTIPVTKPPPPSPYKKHLDRNEDAALAAMYARYDSDPRAKGPNDFEAFVDAVKGEQP